MPSNRPARVRSVQVHGSDRSSALAGERTSLQLVGVDLGEVGRGDQVARPDSVTVSRRWLVRFRLLPSAPKTIKGFLPVRVHVGSAERLGKLRPIGGPVDPGGECLAEVRLDAPVVTSCAATASSSGDHRRRRRWAAVRSSTRHLHRCAASSSRPWRRSSPVQLPEALLAWAELQGEAGLDA